ncbi:TIGR02444 family protein [Methylobacterium sp. D54C]
MSDNPFWDFSLALYRRPGLAPACVALQDEGGADVNLVLYLLWCAATGRSLDAGAVRAADAGIAPWREAVVEPLRAVRRALKAEPLERLGSEAYRGRIKAVELEAERLVQDSLFVGAPAPGPALDREQAARDHLGHYAGLLGRPFPPEPLRVLLDGFAGA